MKKLLCCMLTIVCVLALSFGLIACNPVDSSSTSSGSESVAPESGSSSESASSGNEENQGTPTLSLNVSSVAVDLNEELTVTATVAIGENVLDSANLNWAIVEGEATDVVTLEVSSDTLSATLTGVKYGSTMITVSTVVDELPLVKTLEVVCGRLGISFEVD